MEHFKMLGSRIEWINYFDFDIQLIDNIGFDNIKGKEETDFEVKAQHFSNLNIPEQLGDQHKVKCKLEI